MNFSERMAQINERGHLCVGLDPVPGKLPEGVTPDRKGIGHFVGALIEATSPYAVAYKPNTAFYEALGSWGWEILEGIREAIPSDKLFILDAKRGDIGHTAERYAHMAFDHLGADAMTASPFLGADSLEPLMRNPDRGVFLLCLTSNPGAAHWQTAKINRLPVYRQIAAWSREINEHENIGLVAGATRPQQIAEIVEASEGLPLLIPGIGVQGGDIEATVKAAAGAPFVINSSRGITGASMGVDFADAAAEAAAALHQEILQAKANLVSA